MPLALALALARGPSSSRVELVAGAVVQLVEASGLRVRRRASARVVGRVAGRATAPLRTSS